LNRTEDGGLQAHFFIGVNATEKVTDLIEPSLRAMGFELVRVLVQGNQRPVLQVMAERIDRSSMTVEDCAQISRAVSAILDVEDPIPSAYHLEVTSPGLDRPLTRPADFERFAGFEARIETELPIEGRRRFRGRLLGLADDDVRIQLPEGEQRIALGAIKKAKLVLTDELLAASRQERRS
jgi:ribosome maturation factor RimP